MCLLASMMLDKEMIGQVVQIVDREAFYQADHQIIFDVLRQALRAEPPDRRDHPARGAGQAAAARRDRRHRVPRRRSSTPSPPPPTARTTRASSARRRCCGSSSPPATTSSATPTPRTSRPTSSSTRPRRRSSRSPQKKVGNAMVADGGRAARSLRDDRKPRPARPRDRLLRARRHDQRPAERRDDHRRGAAVSMGKTAFAMNIIEHIAADTLLPCGGLLAGNEQAAARPAHALQPRADRRAQAPQGDAPERTSTRTWRTSSASWPRRRSGWTTRRA